MTNVEIRMSKDLRSFPGSARERQCSKFRFACLHRSADRPWRDGGTKQSFGTVGSQAELANQGNGFPAADIRLKFFNLSQFPHHSGNVPVFDH